MKQSPSSEANSHSTSQEIHHLLWNAKVHYCAQSNPPLVPNLSQINPIHTFPPHFLEIHSDIILQSTFGDLGVNKITLK